MGQRARRRYCTAAESAEIWDRWQRGENLTSIVEYTAGTTGISPDVWHSFARSASVDLIFHATHNVYPAG